MKVDIKEIIKIRRELHQIPEVGFFEIKTRNLIKHYLEKYQFDVEDVAETGLVAFKKGKSNSSVAFRADMDGLNVIEQLDVEYKSKHEGYMHACGHDGHMAILLGFAKYISNIDLNKSILLIFQPAEEKPGGANIIVKEGILNKYNVESIFGLHLYPGLEEGKIGLIKGPAMAKCADIDIEIKAKSCHGAMPQSGIDGILVASQLIQSYQSIISRNIDPIEGAVLTFGKITGGEYRTVLASDIKLEGTIRAFNVDTYNLIKERIASINTSLETMYNVKIKSVIKDKYPSVVNDFSLYNLLKNNLNDAVDMKPLTISEDFSYYQQVVPGFFMFLGTKNSDLGYTYPLHSSLFNFNEDVLINGVDTYIKICDSLDVF